MSEEFAHAQPDVFFFFFFSASLSIFSSFAS
jgi:hypothetical protein